jgi:glycosidase
VQWSAEQYGGFSTFTPWIEGDGDHADWNVADQVTDPDSVWSFYKALIAVRRRLPALVYGDVTFYGRRRRNYFAYTRSLGADAAAPVIDRGIHEGKHAAREGGAASDAEAGSRYLVECNLSPSERYRPDLPLNGLELVLSTYPGADVGAPRPRGPMRPYEASIYRVTA